MLHPAQLSPSLPPPGLPAQPQVEPSPRRFTQCCCRSNTRVLLLRLCSYGVHEPSQQPRESGTPCPTHFTE